MQHFTLKTLWSALLLTLAVMVSGGVWGQSTIYLHDFGTTTISAHPYTIVPGTFEANLSNSSWSNSTGLWTNYAGSSGEAISLSNSSGTPTITLTFDIAAGYEVSISQFNFWRRRSSTGAQNWSMTINSISVGSGTVPTVGAAIGNTNVSNPVSGLTSNITVVISLSDASGTGTFRLDDFQLIGTVSSSSSGPANPASLTATASSSTQIDISWAKNLADDNVMIVYDEDNTFTDPDDGTSYSVSATALGGTVIYNGSGTSYNHTSLTANTQYFYKAWSVDAGNNYSTGVTADATTECDTPVNVNDFAAVSGNTELNLSWTNSSCFDEVLIIAKAGSSVGATPSGDGSSYTANAAFGSGTQIASDEFIVYKGTGTSVTVTGLINGTNYYLKTFVRKVTTWSSGVEINQFAANVVAPTAGVVFISEISESSSTTSEYLELYNNSKDIIDLSNSKLVRVDANSNTSEYVFDISATSGLKQINPESVAIISRGADRSAFETDWGITLTQNVVFIVGNDFLYFGASTQRRWRFSDAGLVNTDDGDIIDDTESAAAGSGNRTYQFPMDTWTTESYSGKSSPGSIGFNEDPAAYVWDGGAGTSNWADANNWNPNQVPGPNTNVTIPASKVDLIIQPTVEADCYNLVVNGTLTIQSGESNTGSLIINGSATGNITVERYITAATDWISANDGWHLLASPVASQAISGAWTPNGLSSNDYDFYAWDESQQLYLNQKLGANNINTFDPGVGYFVAYQATATPLFTGAPNTTNQTENLTLSGAPASNNSYGYNLLGNPFQSAIDWSHASWDKTDVGGVAKIWNNGAFIDIDDDPSIIPAMNGFFVSTSSDNNSFTIPAAARVHNSQNWYKSKSNNTIKLIAKDVEGNLQQESRIRFNSEATDGFDQAFDGPFMTGYAPLFYSTDETHLYSTNTLPAFNNDLEIPFSFIKNANSSFEIELKQSIEGVVVYLTDLKSNTQYNLTENPVYHFTASEDDNPNRFVLHFGALSIDDNPNQLAATAFVHGGQLYILNGKGMTDIRVLDVQGRLLQSFSQNVEGLFNTSFTLPAGLYIIQLQDAQGVRNNKVISH